MTTQELEALGFIPVSSKLKPRRFFINDMEFHILEHMTIADVIDMAHDRGHDEGIQDGMEQKAKEFRDLLNIGEILNQS